MALNCGIVGLPNVGKTTIFSAMTSVQAETANYKFSTIEPNIGVVDVNDPRLSKIAELIVPKKLIPTAVEIVDIAGLVEGASRGEGLGNRFLGHIRQVNAIVHVVRCFKNDDVVHIREELDPIQDIEIINMELALADAEVVEKKLNNLEKSLKSHNKEIVKKARMQKPVLDKLQEILSEGQLARSAELDPQDLELVNDIGLITTKKMLYVCNVDEAGLENKSKYVEDVEEYAKKMGDEVFSLCGDLEAEISALDTEEEKKEFLADVGIVEPCLDRLIVSAYRMLGFRTFFTAGEKEVRAWTFKEGSKAPVAAGVIHSDFERGFIKAEVYHCEDLFNFKSEAKVKENGKFRIEGKEYIVKDGDVMHFRFNV